MALNKEKLEKSLDDIRNLLDLELPSNGEDTSENNKSMLLERAPRKGKNYPLNSIIYGAPGTGKTYSTVNYALAFIDSSQVDLSEKTYDERKDIIKRYNALVAKEQIVFTTFHQNYSYEDFIQGLRPDPNSATISFKPFDGVFKRIADKALKDHQNNYVIIIDEINRANISKVFGELITLIEEDKRWGEINQTSVTLPSGEVFTVPNNLYILGTMNSSDKSISLIDAALRRRFEFIEQRPNEMLISDIDLRKVFRAINNRLVADFETSDLLIGHSYFMNSTIDELDRIMNSQIIPLLYEYFYDNKKKVASVVKDSISGTKYEISDEKYGRLSIKKTGA